MVSHPEDLIPQRRRSDAVILFIPLVPLLPLVAAAPPRHEEDAVTIRQVIELIAFELPLEADRIEPHLAHVSKFRLEPFGGFGSEQHVRSPAAASNQDGLSVHLEEAMSLVGQLGRHVLNAEGDLLRVSRGTVLRRRQRQRIQLLPAHAIRPPHARLHDRERLDAIGREGDRLALARPERDRLLERRRFDGSADDAAHRRSGHVPDFGADRQRRAIERGHIQRRHDEWIADRHWPTLREVHPAPEAHVLVWRRRIPVHPHDGEIVRLGGDNFHRKSVWTGPAYLLRDIDLVSSEDANDVFGGCELFAVQPDIRAVVDAIEMQRHVTTGTGAHRELRAIPPRVFERAVGRHRQQCESLADRIRRSRDLAQVHPDVRIGILTVLDQSTHHGVGHGDGVPAARVDARCRERVPFCPDFRRRLQHPAGAEGRPLIGRCDQWAEHHGQDRERPHQ